MAAVRSPDASAIKPFTIDELFNFSNDELVQKICEVAKDLLEANKACERERNGIFQRLHILMKRGEGEFVEECIRAGLKISGPHSLFEGTGGIDDDFNAALQLIKNAQPEPGQNNQTLESCLDLSRDKIDAYLEEYQKKVLEGVAYHSEIKAISIRLRSQSENLEKSDNRVSALLEESLSIATTIKSKEEEKGKLDEELSRVNARIAEISAEINQLQHRKTGDKTRIKRRIENLKNERSDLAQKKGDYTKKIAELESELISLSNEDGVVNVQMDKWIRKSDNREDEIEFDATQMKIKELQEAMKKAEQAASRAMQQLIAGVRVHQLSHRVEVLEKREKQLHIEMQRRGLVDVK